MNKKLIREKQKKLFELNIKLELLQDSEIEEIEKTLKEIEQTQDEIKWLRREETNVRES